MAAQPESKEGDNLVTWSSPDDPQNPKNWPSSKKWRMIAYSSSLALITLISTSMVAPALPVIAKDFQIESGLEQIMVISVFTLGTAIGSLLAGPLSEIYGRLLVTQLFGIVYLAFNTACGFAANTKQLIIFRAFAGLGGSAASPLGAGVLSDLYLADDLALPVSIFSSVTLFGPTVGPIVGGFLTQYVSWRWSFWTISIASAVFQICTVVLGRETYPPVLLRRKAAELRASTGNQLLRTKEESSGHVTHTILAKALVRPLILITTQPIFQLLTLFLCYIFGLVYFALATFAALWTDQYGESVSISSLNYLSLALGYIVGLQACTKFTNLTYRHLKATKGNGVGAPEYRLPVMLPGAVMATAGLLWYGWSAQYRVHWIMPNIGMLIFGTGVKFTSQSVQLYALDVYPKYAASAGAASNFLRYLFGFSFPLFGPALYQSLGYGLGNTVLAAIAISVGICTPALLWCFGATLRRKSPYASGDS